LVITLTACLSPKPNVLYIDNSVPDTSFYQADIIFHDVMTSEFWTSTAECLYADAIPEAGYNSPVGIYVKWDRLTFGCPWQGIGFGWDNWTGKDLSEIKNEAAIEFYVRMPKGERKSLPWAAGLEDFTGAQAWLGLNPNTQMADKITEEWSRVVLPLSEFNWNEQNADPGNIKQLIIQMDAEGEIYIDEIRIVPYQGGFRKRAELTELEPGGFIVDGATGDALWTTQGQYFSKHEVHLAVMGNNLCVGLQTTDDTPLQNSFVDDGTRVFEGDGLELCFAMDDEAASTRIRLLSTDQHLTFALGEKIKVWDNRKHQFIEGVETAARAIRDGYVFEAKIPLDQLTENTLLPEKLYSLEIAVNDGDKKQRLRQDRWNTANQPGYYANPSIWGEMLIQRRENDAGNP
jgi:hypothetical protein